VRASALRKREPRARLDPRVKRIGIVTVLGSVMSVLDTMVVNVALDSLSRKLHTDIKTIQWVVTGYLLALAATLPISAWAARRIGVKRLYMLSLLIFTIGSGLCCGRGYFRTIDELIGVPREAVERMDVGAFPRRQKQRGEEVGAPVFSVQLTAGAVGGCQLRGHVVELALLADK
jgi:MFS family permease